MLELPQPLHLPIVLIHRLLAAIHMIRAVVARTVLPIVAAARAIRVRSVRVGRSVRPQRVRARISIVHIEGQIIRLRSGKSDRIVDAEELV
jgi:hypothetical protein